MKWEDVSSSLLALYPELKTDVVRSGSLSARWFFLPSGFKDIGNALVFGFVTWGSEVENKMLLRELEIVARQNGVAKLVGPLNFSTFFDYRLRVDHFDLPQYKGEPASFPAAVSALEASGYRSIKKLFHSSCQASF